MAEQIHIVPHFHWDREWYFTAEESRILLVNDMEEVLSMLEQEEDYPCFVLDGQTAVLEDYFAVKPENFQRVKALVEQGRLIIGPWYTQTDEMVVGGESIVRNLLYGKMDCEKLGPAMMIGYLPDSFGQSARLPQILNGFGIKRCMFWRGTSERMGTDKTEFYWEGDDGAKVICQLLPLGYAIGKYLPEDKEELKKRLDKYLPILDKGASTHKILLPNGHDQMPIQKNIFKIMKLILELYPERTVSLGRYEDVFEEIEKVSDLAVLTGEFLDGKYMRVHRSIYSSRSDLKSANTRIENKITNILEPLMSIAYCLGIEYQHGLVEAIWKELLKNHAHDSIGCCCSDIVHKAIEDRFFQAELRTDRLIEFYKRRITDSIPDDISLDKLTAFNLLPYERTEVITGEIVTRMQDFKLADESGNEISYEIIGTEVVDPGLIDRQIVHYGNYNPFIRYQIMLQEKLPAMGYCTFYIKEHAKREDFGKSSETMKRFQDESEIVSSDFIENSFYKIWPQKNGTLTILDKETEIQYEDVFLLEDGSDDGDGYDYSPMEDDYILTSHDAEAKTAVKTSKYQSEIQIQLDMKVPEDLDSRKKRVRTGLVQVELTVRLKKDSPVIEVCLAVNNQARDHRFRVLLPNRLSAACCISDNQFGSISRPVRDDAMDVWEQENWSERPDSIYPFLSYVHGDTETGIAVLTNSVREYEMTGEHMDVLAVTLFRSVGVLGKENLVRRPGRPSGIRMETPDSQLLGKREYQFGITTKIQEVPRLAKEYLTPAVTYHKMPYNAMKLNPALVTLPGSFSLLHVDNKDVVISAVKKAEKGKGIICRFYNPLEDTEFMVESGFSHKTVVRLDETAVEGEMSGEMIELRHNQNVSLLFE